MKRLLFAVVSLCLCMQISAQEEYEAFAISEFAYSMSGDDSQCYAILKKDFMQTEEFVELFSAVMECYAEYGATQKASPKAKAVMDKVKSYALGGRVFARVTPFQDGTFGVVDYPYIDGVGNLEKWGLLDERGNLTIPFAYRSIQELGGNTYGVEEYKREDALFGTVDKQGRIIIPLKYEVLVGDIWSHRYGHVILRLPNGKVGMLNLDGSAAIPFQFDGFGDEYDHCIVAWVGKNKILIDKTGKRITAQQYDKIWGDDEDHIIGRRSDVNYHLSSTGQELGKAD
jgi:hypothetical protein